MKLSKRAAGFVFSKTNARTSNYRGFQSSAPALVRILATDRIDDVCMQIFKERGHQVDVRKSMPEEELCAVIGDYDAMVIRSATKVTPKVIQAASKLRVIGRAGVGVDNIDIPAATTAGILVMNTPDGNTVSTAQLALSLMLSLARMIPAANASVKRGNWSKKEFGGVEVMGKTLGIIGCGRVGQVVADTAQTLGMNVIGHDPVVSADTLRATGIKNADLDEVWRKSDFITVHTPLTRTTTAIVNDESLSQCKDGVRLINCARGGIVCETSLLRGLESGKVAGAAVDVFTTEPPGKDLTAFLTHPNLICTPHLGASTEEAQINVARDIAVQISDMFDNKNFTGIVNAPFMALSTNPAMKPFMRLAETLGSMQAQMGESRPSNVVLKTWGGRDVDITSTPARKLLEAQLLTGMLKSVPELGLAPDLISASSMAAIANLTTELSEELPDNVGSPYVNLMQVEVTRTDGRVEVITGAVFGSTGHVVQVDNYRDSFSYVPQGKYILTFQNQDKPGAISEVLSILHDANVNVASMNVASASGMKHKKKKVEKSLALCFMSLDDDVPQNAMNALRASVTLSAVYKIQL